MRHPTWMEPSFGASHGAVKKRITLEAQARTSLFGSQHRNRHLRMAARVRYGWPMVLLIPMQSALAASKLNIKRKISLSDPSEMN